MKKQEKNFAFIDSQNVYKGVRRDLGWQLDWSRFRVYLKHKYDIATAYLFIGFLPEHNDIERKAIKKKKHRVGTEPLRNAFSYGYFYVSKSKKISQ